MASDGTRLYVGDYNNQRVLIWNTISAATGANLVLGQPNMTSNTNFGATASSFFNPGGVATDGDEDLHVGHQLEPGSRVELDSRRKYHAAREIPSWAKAV